MRSNLARAAGQDVVAAFVEFKCAVAGVESLVAVLEDEQPVARKCKVGIFACLLRRSVREQQVDTFNRRAETDLTRVNAAEVVCRRRGVALQLRKHIRKSCAAALKADCVNVGDVVADNVHARLVNFYTGNSRIQGTHHDNHFSFFCEGQMNLTVPCP